MSWLISKTGSKEEVQKYLDEEAPKAIAHVTGIERSLADQALGLVRAVVAANEKPEQYNHSVSAGGSAMFDAEQKQLGQSLAINVSLLYKS